MKNGCLNSKKTINYPSGEGDPEFNEESMNINLVR